MRLRIVVDLPPRPERTEGRRDEPVRVALQALGVGEVVARDPGRRARGRAGRPELAEAECERKAVAYATKPISRCRCVDQNVAGGSYLSMKSRYPKALGYFTA